jgi:NAD(P)-dependent dehydrogenase (short-subunit alcohol dehydrogenase family)
VPGRMEGKKAVVVGAGQPAHELLGNGRAIATLLAREGAEVCAVDRDRDRVQQTVEEIAAAGGRAHALVADISDPGDCGRLIAEAHAALGRIDVLVNNVGVNDGDGDPVELTEDGWQRIMDINLRGTWLTARAVIPLMQEQRRGAITNISSIAARTGGARLAYGISKAGVNALTHSLAVTYAPWGIRCNSVMPAWIATPHAMEGLIGAGTSSSEEEVVALARRLAPLGRMGTAMDIAHAVLFLSSDEAGFITGLDVPVDGGALAVVGSFQRPAGAPTDAG